MYFTKLAKNHLPAVANLERQAYPNELVLGLKDFEEDYVTKGLSRYSICGFSGGELACYITAYPIKEYNFEQDKKSIYISDINCPNPRHLKHLLLQFFWQFYNENAVITPVFLADLRINSYKLLSNQQKKNPTAIRILKQQFIPQYYTNDEPAYQVSFTVNILGCLWLDWKWIFLCELRNKFEESWRHTPNFLSEAFYSLEAPIAQGIDLYSEENMAFIISALKEIYLDYYQMFDKKIPAMLHHVLKFRKGINHSNLNKVIDSLTKWGYQKDSFTAKRYFYNQDLNSIITTREIEVFNTPFRNSLSGYRWLVKKQYTYLSKIGKDYHMSCKDKFGEPKPLLPIPYLTKTHYRHYLEEKICLLRKKQLLQNDGNQQDFTILTQIVRTIFRLLPFQDAHTAVDNICSRYSPSISNYFHDWNLIVDSIFKSKASLTKGAVKTIFSLSYNQAHQVNKHIETIRELLSAPKWTQKLFDRHDIRRNLSVLIRTRKDCSAYVSSLSQQLSEEFCKKMHLQTSEQEKLDSFIGRMQKYCQSVNIQSLYQRFGKKCLSQFITGTYPSLFTAQEFHPSFEPMAVFIKELFQKKIPQTKHLYGDLKRASLLPSVLRGNLSVQQYQQVLQMMKKRNIKVTNTLRQLADFKVLIEPKGSPEFLVAGDATVCCMSYGHKKAMDYALEKGFGIINIYYKERIIANSVIWINEPYQCLVLDNIEVHQNYIKFQQELAYCFHIVVDSLMHQHHLKFVVQGTQYNDLKLYNEQAQLIKFRKLKPVDVHIEDFYTDAYLSKVVRSVVSSDVVEQLIQSADQNIAA